MAKIPNAESAYIEPAKLIEYLLCLSHPTGGPKARLFHRFGFSASEPATLEAALLELARTGEAVMISDGRGHRFTIRGPIPTPVGRTLHEVSVWHAASLGDPPRLVTAYAR